MSDPLFCSSVLASGMFADDFLCLLDPGIFPLCFFAEASESSPLCVSNPPLHFPCFSCDEISSMGGHNCTLAHTKVSRCTMWRRAGVLVDIHRDTDPFFCRPRPFLSVDMESPLTNTSSQIIVGHLRSYFTSPSLSSIMHLNHRVSVHKD